MSNNRLKIIAIIGAKSFSDGIEAHIGHALTEKWGGCFISKGDGFWSSKGNNFQDDYPANSVVHEKSLKVEVTVMPGAELEAVNSIREVMSEVKDKDSNFFRFVHIEKIACTTDHQDLKFKALNGIEDKKHKDDLI